MWLGMIFETRTSCSQQASTLSVERAVSGSMELKKRLTRNILPDMIIKAQDGVTNNIMIDFKSL
jgi:hypothetical protein